MNHTVPPLSPWRSSSAGTRAVAANRGTFWFAFLVTLATIAIVATGCGGTTTAANGKRGVQEILPARCPEVVGYRKRRTELPAKVEPGTNTIDLEPIPEPVVSPEVERAAGWQGRRSRRIQGDSSMQPDAAQRAAQPTEGRQGSGIGS